MPRRRPQSCRWSESMQAVSRCPPALSDALRPPIHQVPLLPRLQDFHSQIVFDRSERAIHLREIGLSLHVHVTKQFGEPQCELALLTLLTLVHEGAHASDIRVAAA